MAERETEGKAIDLGQKMGGAEITAKPKNEKWYPTMHVDGLTADSPLVKKGAGSNCSAGIELKIKNISENADGKYSVTLEARSLELY
jgi:hypothetical protein